MELLAALPHRELRARFVWVPVLGADDEAAAAAAERRFAEARASHYWDGERALATALGRALGISEGESVAAGEGHGLAWDVYAAYGRGSADVFAPALWMHQLQVTRAPRLDAEAFRERVERLLSA